MHRRIGLTLIEIILSMAVLAVLSAVVVPPMAMLLDDRRLNRAADLVQIEIAKIRLDAMRHGQVLVVNGVIGGDRILVGPYFTYDESTESAIAGPSALATGADQAVIGSPAPINFRQREIELPEGISLQLIQVLASARAAQTQSDGLSSAVNLQAAAAANSASIYFYPDGTCSDAAIDLHGAEDYDLRVMIRGVSGQSRVVEVGL